MDVLGRNTAPFSGRVWQQIDATVAAIKISNCTARRFLEIDGPYGLGLTSLAGDDVRLAPAVPEPGATAAAWDVPRSVPIRDSVGGALIGGPDPDDQPYTRGTVLVQSQTRPVALIASEFVLGVRNVEAFDDECQPLDLTRVTRAARDVALEEERLIYYGNPAQGHDGLLQVIAGQTTVAPIRPPTPLRLITQALHLAIDNLAARGFPGHFALAAFPDFYTRLYAQIENSDIVSADLLRELFVKGVHMVPVIAPPRVAGTGPGELQPMPGAPVGVIVTTGGPYARLVVGQDWTVSYRGISGVYHRFLLVSSLRLQISEPRSLQVFLG